MSISAYASILIVDTEGVICCPDNPTAWSMTVKVPTADVKATPVNPISWSKGVIAPELTVIAPGAVKETTGLESIVKEPTSEVADTPVMLNAN